MPCRSEPGARNPRATLPPEPQPPFSSLWISPGGAHRTGRRLRVSLHLGTGRIIRADAHDADALDPLRMQALGVVPADPWEHGTFYLVSSR